MFSSIISLEVSTIAKFSDAFFSDDVSQLIKLLDAIIKDDTTNVFLKMFLMISTFFVLLHCKSSLEESLNFSCFRIREISIRIRKLNCNTNKKPVNDCRFLVLLNLLD